MKNISLTSASLLPPQLITSTSAHTPNSVPRFINANCLMVLTTSGGEGKSSTIKFL